MVATHHLVAQALSAYDDPLQSQGWSFHIFLKKSQKVVNVLNIRLQPDEMSYCKSAGEL
jgi:hypothetical protein